MALNTAQLQTDLQALFAAPSPNLTTLAGQWGDAMQVFFTGVVPPSTTVATAITTFKASMVTDMPAGPAAVDAALTALATAIGLGMVPAFVSTPPPTPPIATNMGGAFPATHAAAAIKWAGVFDAWAKTGIATPPVGPPILWT